VAKKRLINILIRWELHRRGIFFAIGRYIPFFNEILYMEGRNC
jgi:hypothetical protein